MAKTKHMTITVPIDLKEEMDRVAKKVKFNWSFLACDAFRSAIDRHLRNQEIAEMTSTIKRWQAAEVHDGNEK